MVSDGPTWASSGEVIDLTIEKVISLPGLSLKASAASCNKTEFFSASAGVSAVAFGRNRRLAGAGAAVSAAAGSPSASGCELNSGLGAVGLQKLALNFERLLFL